MLGGRGVAGVNDTQGKGSGVTAIITTLTLNIRSVLANRKQQKTFLLSSRVPLHLQRRRARARVRVCVCEMSPWFFQTKRTVGHSAVSPREDI